jgi:hypothetical protein
LIAGGALFRHGIVGGAIYYMDGCGCKAYA